METFSAELQQRIATARRELRAARESGDLDAERVYAGELDSLLRLAAENDVVVPTESGEHD
ncbi:MAG TPA: hypothetical protein VG497_10005 [Kribbella sp.]|nr:hypothetical protein [Kribbella sp.]